MPPLTETRSIKICSNCRQANSLDAFLCAKCGFDQFEQVRPAEEVKSINQQEIPNGGVPPASVSGIVCPDPTCAFVNPAGSEICAVCNGKLTGPTTPATSHQVHQQAHATKPQQADTPAPAASSSNLSIIPYRTGGKEFTNLHDIALYFTTNWDEGMKQIDETYLLTWAESNFPQYIDVDSLDFVKKLTRKQGIADDVRLTQFITRFVPELPPVWNGIALSRENIISLLERANDGDGNARAKASELHQRDILSSILVARKSSDIEWCRDAIKAADESFKKAVELLKSAEGPGDAVSSDKSVTAPALMLAALSEKHREMLRSSIQQVAENKLNASDDNESGTNRSSVSDTLGKVILRGLLNYQSKIQGKKVTSTCKWFNALGNVTSADPGMLVLMSMVATFIRDDKEPGRDKAETLEHDFSSNGICRVCGFSEGFTSRFNSFCKPTIEIDRRKKVFEQKVRIAKYSCITVIIILAVFASIHKTQIHEKSSIISTIQVPVPTIPVSQSTTTYQETPVTKPIEPPPPGS